MLCVPAALRKEEVEKWYQVVPELRREWRVCVGGVVYTKEEVEEWYLS